MNRLQLETIRKSNFHKLDTAFRPKKNAVELDINNSMEHNLALTICQILIRKGFPASQLQVVIDKIFFKGAIPKPIALLETKFEHEWERPQIITEARFKKEFSVRSKQDKVDIFILDTGERICIETGKSYEKEKDVITVRV